MQFFVGDRVKVFVDNEGQFKHLYDAVVVEANDDQARIQVRSGTYGFWFYQANGKKVGVDNGRFIRKSLKYRSIDEE